MVIGAEDHKVVLVKKVFEHIATSMLRFYYTFIFFFHEILYHTLETVPSKVALSNVKKGITLCHFRLYCVIN